jgi:hypothetical protein
MDEGDWDTTAPPGTSGRLYRCTATNVWSLYYTPFTYPHPGTADSGPAPVPTLFTLSIDRTGSGAGRVTSAPGGIDCGTACSANFPAGTAVTLTATPDSGSSFDGWSACGGTGSCDIVLTGSTTLTATFAGTTAPPPTLSMSANPLSVQPGETSTLTWSSTNATGCTAANAGADGSTWRGPKATNGIDVRGPLEATATYTLTCEGPGGTVSRSVIIEVVAAPPTWSLTARVTGPGTIAVSGCDILNCLWCTVALPAGTTVILTPRPHPGARFIGWVGTDGCSTAGPCTLTMTSARTVTARFAMP